MRKRAVSVRRSSGARPSDFQRFLATTQSAAPASLPRDLGPIGIALLTA